MSQLVKWFKGGDKGEINIASILLMGIGMVFLAVGFIMFPIVTDATDTLLAYTYTGNITVTDASYTGFTAVVGITPLLILLGFLSASVFSMYMGVKVAKTGAGSTSLNLGSLIMLALSMVFVAIGLIILPVALDGISSIVAGDATGPMSTAYTGLSSILYVTPLLILISFVSAAVITGYFGIKKLGT